MFASTVQAASPIISHAPRIAVPTQSSLVKNGPNFGWSSTNWSGYAITGGPYNSITGTWKVTAVSSTSGSSYSSTWIGIDGFNNSDLIQTGTEADYYNKSAHYNAWWEILPAAETPISMTVTPGDTMSASITNQGGGKWLITIKDVTRNESFSTTQSYSGPLSSAEWIQEAPTVNGRVATLAHYGQVTMDPGTVNGGNPYLTTSEGGTMTNSRGTTVISTPSTPDADTDGFNVAYGSTSPAAPNS